MRKASPSPSELPILIAEDNEVTAEIIVWNLVKHGFETRVARDGQEALDVLETHADIGLLITDVMMPDLDGLGLLTEMRQRCYLRDLPVIVTSTNADERTVTHIAELGYRRFLVKPFNGIQLLEVVHQAVGDQPPILAPRHAVLSSRGIDAQTYVRLLGLLRDLTAAALTQLDDHGADQRDVAPPDFPHLAEAAALLGAERLSRLFARLAHDGTRADALHRWLARELQVLHDALARTVSPASTTAREDATAHDPSATSRGPARPLALRTDKWWKLSGDAASAKARDLGSVDRSPIRSPIQSPPQSPSPRSAKGTSLSAVERSVQAGARHDRG